MKLSVYEIIIFYFFTKNGALFAVHIVSV